MAETMTDALLRNITGIAAGETSQIANIAAGGQLGIGSHLRKIDAATPLVMTPAVAIVTHAPTMFENVPGAKEVLKALIERHAKSITGIDFGYTLDSGQIMAGHDGQELNIPTDSKRTAVNPSFTFPELQGNLVWNFFKMWISMIRHPDTNASSLSAILAEGGFDPMLYSSFSMDMCVIQYDPTMHPDNIIGAYFYTAMYPQETGLVGIQRELGTTQVMERVIPMVGMVQDNSRTHEAGIQIAKALALHKADYSSMPAIADAIESTLSNQGVHQEIEEIAAAIA
jgi:hypothetical protein